MYFKRDTHNSRSLIKEKLFWHDVGLLKLEFIKKFKQTGKS